VRCSLESVVVAQRVFAAILCDGISQKIHNINILKADLPRCQTY
jgi:hypothetical protein